MIRGDQRGRAGEQRDGGRHVAEGIRAARSSGKTRRASFGKQDVGLADRPQLEPVPVCLLEMVTDDLVQV